MTDLHQTPRPPASHVDSAIAIIGMACRLPGGVDSPESFWSLLEEGRRGIRELDDTRWRHGHYYDPNPEAAGKTYARHAGLIEDIDSFDAEFFGISHREAKDLDPQQRLLLEVGWHAMEDAGITHAEFSGSRTGLFLGMGADDYARHSLGSGLTQRINAYSSLGNARSIAAGRVAYSLNLRGPVVQLDTSCSSSLMAVQLAVNSLRTGGCETALAGGVNLLLAPQGFISLSKLKALSKSGGCRPFDEAADGYVRGEGCALVLLQPYAQAKRAGRKILAVIREIGANHDGRSNGLTAPNGSAQEELIRETFRKAGVQPKDAAYFETHGTGTPLGDPIEVISLANVIGETPRKIPIGSLKANIGHLEACAGIASLMKAVLMLRHNRAPGQVQVSELNRKIPWADIPLFVPLRSQALCESGGERLIGVSAFGMSGTNVHCLIGYDPAETQVEQAQPAKGGVLTISARSPETALRYAGDYERFLRHSTEPAAVIMAGSNHQRTHFEYRIAVVGDSRQELAQRLAERCANPEPLDRRTTGPIGFVFGDADYQNHPDCKHLYRDYPAYRAAFDECLADIQVLHGPLPHALWDYGREGLAAFPELLQCAWFVHGYSTARLLESAGVTARAVLGRGVGEYVAGAIAGVLSVTDAICLVWARADLPARLRRRGALLEIDAAFETIDPILKAQRFSPELTAVDAAEQCTLAGEPEDLADLAHRLDERGIGSRLQKPPAAYNSSFIEPLIGSIEALVQTIDLQPPRRAMISAVSAQADAQEISSQRHWVRCLRAPVQFHAALTGMCDELKIESILDIGTSLRYRSTATDTARRPVAENHTANPLDALLAELYENGVMIDWRRVRPAMRPVKIPDYPFERGRFWISEPDSPPAGMLAAAAGGLVQHSPERIGRALRRHREHIDGLQVNQDAFRELFETILSELSAPEEAAVRMYDLCWKPGANIPAGLPALDEIAERACDGLRQAAAAAKVQEAAQAYPRLERLAEYYARSALLDMGWRARAGDRVRLSEIAAELKVNPRQTRFLGRVLEIAGTQREPDGQDPCWRVPETFQDLRGSWSEEEDAIPEALRPELNLLRQCGKVLAAVLKGECDAKEVIFEKGDLSSSEQLYEDSASSQIMNGCLRDCVASLLEARPDSDRVRILELGAGTGATMGYVLPVLDQQRHEYWFTDVSTFFLQKARNKFRDYPNVRYRIYDAELPGDSQGVAETFDIIIAANVIHATKDVRQTLADLRDRLKPNGVILLLEGNRPLKWMDVFAGSLEGWWRFTDTQLRGNHPLLSVPAWQGLFTELGYADCGDLTPDPEQAGMLSQQSILYARKPGPQDSGHTRAWLITGDCATVARSSEPLVRYCTDQGDSVHLIEREQLAEAVQYAKSLGQEVRIINFLADTPARDPIDQDALDVCIQQVQGLVRTLQCLPGGIDLSLWHITAGTVPVALAPTESQVLQSILHGYLKVAAIEYNTLKQTTIDLRPEADEQDWKLVHRLIAEGRGETQYAVRVGQVLVPRIVPATRPQSASVLRVEAGKTYLLAGGNGGLGRQSIDYLARRGAEHIVVLTRRRDTAACRKEIIAAVSATNLRIDVETCDITQIGQVTDVIDKYDRNGRTLGGVLHAAGIRAQQDLNHFDPVQARSVLQPKVLGLVNLHQALKGRPLDFFVCYSSMSSLWGAAKLGHYCAANQFMDVYSAHLASQGVPVISINWGPMSDGGMTEEAELQALSGLGAHPVPLAAGLEELDRLGAGGHSGLLLADIEWDKFLDWLQARGTTGEMFEELPVSPSRPQAEDAQPQATADPSNPSSPQDASISEYMKRLVSRQLEIPMDSIDLDKSLVEYGVDSLMAVDLRDALYKDQGVKLEMVRFMSETSLCALIDEISEQLSTAADLSGGQQPEPASGEADLPTAEQIDGMSVDEIEALYETMSKGGDPAQPGRGQ